MRFHLINWSNKSKKKLLILKEFLIFEKSFQIGIGMKFMDIFHLWGNVQVKSKWDPFFQEGAGPKI